MPHNLKPFKTITYSLSSERLASKFAFQVRNLQRYTAATGADATALAPCLSYTVGRCTLESS